MDGILNLAKPVGITSAKAVAHVRRLLRQRKSGHAGSLDPLASGVLVVCLGRATKLVEAVMDQPKVYRATAALDVTSTSFDGETPPTPIAVPRPPDARQVAEALHSLEGASAQVPPAASALKRGGRPAYALHRAGRAPVLAARPIRIYWVHVHQYEWPWLDFELACGRGTYIRALVRDIGLRLGTGGCLKSLTRRAVGPFRIEESWPLERLAALPDPAAAVLPLEQAQAFLALRPIQIPARPT
jgi:tRNA pseudouridine55 synthase